jgi:acyl carrier protein
MIAYIVFREGIARDEGSLRARLGRDLPHYMLPGRFIMMETLPRTSRGKVDRSALPPPGRAQRGVGAPFVAAVTETEKRLAAIWGDILDLDDAGMQDSFFELGGDSLTGMRMILTVERTFGCIVPFRFFAVPTLANLSEFVAGDSGRGAGNGEFAAARTERKKRKRLRQPGGIQRLYPWLYPLLKQGMKMLLARQLTSIKVRHAILSSPLLPWRQYENQRQLVARFLDASGLPGPHTAAMRKSVILNAWPWWINRLVSSENFDRWISVKGGAEVGAALGCGRGLIVVFLHQPMVTLLTKKYLLRWGSVETMTIEGGKQANGEAEKAAERLKNTRLAMDLLKRGGTAFISSDGLDRKNPAWVAVPGCRMALARGFAEISLLSQVPVAALFLSMEQSGHICLEFLTFDAARDENGVEEMFREYERELARRWLDLVPTMTWPQLQHIIQSVNFTVRE